MGGSDRVFCFEAFLDGKCVDGVVLLEQLLKRVQRSELDYQPRVRVEDAFLTVIGSPDDPLRPVHLLLIDVIKAIEYWHSGFDYHEIEGVYQKIEGWLAGGGRVWQDQRMVGDVDKGLEVYGPDGKWWKIAELIGCEIHVAPYRFFWFQAKDGTRSRVAVPSSFMGLDSFTKSYKGGV